jgi:hypothetical protein
MPNFASNGLGRLIPSDWDHVRKYPLMRGVLAVPTSFVAERTLFLPSYRVFYNQGREGACVGFAASWMMSILNKKLYNARWLWDRAKEVDEWPLSKPGDFNGTSVRAAMDVLRTIGHLCYNEKQPSITEGIIENRWATTIDEIRLSIQNGSPVVFGFNWYHAFDHPRTYQGEWWVGRETDWAGVRGGHSVCGFQVSDQRQAFGFVNSWGLAYRRVG